MEERKYYMRVMQSLDGALNELTDKIGTDTITESSIRNLFSKRPSSGDTSVISAISAYLSRLEQYAPIINNRSIALHITICRGILEGINDAPYVLIQLLLKLNQSTRGSFTNKLRELITNATESVRLALDSTLGTIPTYDILHSRPEFKSENAASTGIFGSSFFDYTSLLKIFCKSRPDPSDRAGGAGASVVEANACPTLTDEISRNISKMYRRFGHKAHIHLTTASNAEDALSLALAGAEFARRILPSSKWTDRWTRSEDVDTFYTDNGPRMLSQIKAAISQRQLLINKITELSLESASSIIRDTVLTDRLNVITNEIQRRVIRALELRTHRAGAGAVIAEDDTDDNDNNDDTNNSASEVERQRLITLARATTEREGEIARRNLNITDVIKRLLRTKPKDKYHVLKDVLGVPSPFLEISTIKIRDLTRGRKPDAAQCAAVLGRFIKNTEDEMAPEQEPCYICGCDINEFREGKVDCEHMLPIFLSSLFFGTFRNLNALSESELIGYKKNLKDNVLVYACHDCNMHKGDDVLVTWLEGATSRIIPHDDIINDLLDKIASDPEIRASGCPPRKVKNVPTPYEASRGKEPITIWKERRLIAIKNKLKTPCDSIMKRNPTAATVAGFFVMTVLEMIDPRNFNDACLLEMLSNIQATADKRAREGLPPYRKEDAVCIYYCILFSITSTVNEFNFSEFSTAYSPGGGAAGARYPPGGGAAGAGAAGAGAGLRYRSYGGGSLSRGSTSNVYVPKNTVYTSKELLPYKLTVTKSSNIDTLPDGELSWSRLIPLFNMIKRVLMKYDRYAAELKYIPLQLETSKPLNLPPTYNVAEKLSLPNISNADLAEAGITREQFEAARASAAPGFRLGTSAIAATGPGYGYGRGGRRRTQRKGKRTPLRSKRRHTTHKRKRRAA